VYKLLSKECLKQRITFYESALCSTEVAKRNEYKPSPSGAGLHFACSMAAATTIRFCSVADFLHASSLYKPYYYGNNCNDKQNMNDASRVKCEKPNQPSNN
jgi:hypothetical protein